MYNEVNCPEGHMCSSDCRRNGCPCDEHEHNNKVCIYAYCTEEATCFYEDLPLCAEHKLDVDDARYDAAVKLAAWTAEAKAKAEANITNFIQSV